MVHSFSDIRTLFSSFLSENLFYKEPQSLYDPMNYLIGLGGKRARPAMALMAHELFGPLTKDAYRIAMAIEVFHNFTLMHDDIIDEATHRRAQPTVHHKYNTNVAILSGDAMMIESYEWISKISKVDLIPSLYSTFNKHALGVCYGQQMDLEFETRNDVTIEEYIEMIRLKTAVLLGCAMSMGARVGGADKQAQEHLQLFGENIGIAFQLQDDYLDTYGDPETFGKRIGGDIIQNKKTYLYLKALELANEKQRDRLTLLYTDQHQLTDEEKVKEVKDIFNTLVIPEYVLQLMDAYNNLGISHLKALGLEEYKYQALLDLCSYLLQRNS